MRYKCYSIRHVYGLSGTVNNVFSSGLSSRSFLVILACNITHHTETFDVAANEVPKTKEEVEKIHAIVKVTAS